MPFVCILGEVDISYIFCFIFQDLLTIRRSFKEEGFASMPVKILRGAITPSSPRFSPGFSRFLQVSPGPTVSDYCLPPDFGSHIFFLQKTWFTILSPPDFQIFLRL